MILAELVLRHTRHTSPTRRLAVERFAHPEDSAPHAPGLLLAGVTVAHLRFIDPVLLPAYDRLLDDREEGRPMPPRALRHRVQTDRVGLDRSEHRLVVVGERPVLEIDWHGPSLPQVVGVLAALDTLRGRRRRVGLELLKEARSLRWTTSADVAAVLLAGADLSALAVRHQAGLTKKQEQALETLGFGVWERPTRGEVLTAFRRLVRDAHPDHGGSALGAGQRMVELAAAPNVLLASVSVGDGG